MYLEVQDCQVCLASKDLLVIQELKEMLEDPESMDNQVFEDPLEIRVTEDLMVSREKWEARVIQENREEMAYLAKRHLTI